MPVAVMAEGAFSFKKLLDQCENQELEVTIRAAQRSRGVSRAPAALVSRVTGPGACGSRAGLGAGAPGRGAGRAESGAWACSVGRGPWPGRPSSLGVSCCLTLAHCASLLLAPPRCCSRSWNLSPPGRGAGGGMRILFRTCARAHAARAWSHRDLF